MARIFTVRWPIFARLEAVLFFPVGLTLAGQITALQDLLNRALMPSLAPLAFRNGIPWQTVVTASATIVMILAYGAGLLLTDRFLTVRRGYAILSVVAIGLWAVAATRLSDQFISDIPPRIWAALNGMPLGRAAAIAAAGLALMFHVPAIWIGLRDQGEVALRLIMHRAEAEYASSPDGEFHRPHDVWLRQSEEFRGWQGQQRLNALGGVPRESPMVKVLYGVAWVGIVVGMFAAFHSGINRASEGRPEVAQPVAPRIGHGVTMVAPDNPERMPISPVAQSHDAHAIIPSAMPAVQRPGEPIGTMAANVHTAPNEAVADRGADGSYSFNVEVNGETLRMMFDTGATVVALRAEDASKVGIDLERLRYTARVKTANGTAEVAPVTIETMSIGNITQHNVMGFVAKQGMLQENLLGQTFLARLAKYNVENNHLVLTGH